MKRPAASDPVAREAGAHLYHQIYTVIRQWILAGNYGVGEALPGENVLAQRFGVARITVRSAIARLQEEGLVEKRHGLGTFVADAAATRSVVHAPMSDVLRHIRDVGRGTQVRLIEVEDVAVPASLRTVFESEAGLRRIVRVRSVNGEPLFHVVTYLPRRIADRFTRADLQRRPMLELLGEAGVRLRSGHQVVGAAVADPVVAELLKLRVGEPLLWIRHTHCDESGRPVEYLELLASAQRFELHMELDSETLRRDAATSTSTPEAP
jgi:GntR family transcriptional regulator